MTILIIIAVVFLMLVFVGLSKKHTPPKRTLQQTQTDELISVILPVINHYK
jgi:hypothetical protein